MVERGLNSYFSVSSGQIDEGALKENRPADVADAPPVSTSRPADF